jgi:hypothetical protein
MRTGLIAAAVGALALTACTPADDDSPAIAASGAATDTAADSAPTGPAADAAPAAERAAPEATDSLSAPGQTPPTLPSDTATTSPATSPPPR